jgi:hypothetical protein
MPDLGIDINLIRDDLRDFFVEKRRDFTVFGSTVNQIFEAFVFASVIRWYEMKGWKTKFVHPKSLNKSQQPVLKLKFNTRGRPDAYSYAVCVLKNESIQIRHGLRVATRKHRNKQKYPANIVLDVAVIANTDLKNFGTDSALENVALLTFGEAKHMSAFAELLANFVGLVYELQPERLKRVRHKKWTPGSHLSPFLYVSGFLYRTALGIQESCQFRRFDFDIFTRTKELAAGVKLPPRTTTNAKTKASP